MNKAIVLGGQSFEIGAIPLGRLRKLLPALSRASIAFHSGAIQEAQFDDVADVLAAVLGKTVEEVEALPMTLPEIAEAMAVAAEVSGLVQGKAKELGEADRDQVSGSTLIPSTPSTPT